MKRKLPPSYIRCIHRNDGNGLRCKNWAMWKGYCAAHWQIEQKLRGAAVLATIVLGFLCILSPVAKAQESAPPLTVHITHNELYPEKYAQNLYWASCRQVWSEIRPDKYVDFPPPEVEVRLGAEKDYKFSFTAQVDGDDKGAEHRKLVFRIDMPDWKHNENQVTKSDRYFATAMIAACEIVVIPYSRFPILADNAIITVNAKVSVEELLRKHKK